MKTARHTHTPSGAKHRYQDVCVGEDGIAEVDAMLVVMHPVPAVASALVALGSAAQALDDVELLATVSHSSQSRSRHWPTIDSCVSSRPTSDGLGLCRRQRRI